MPRRNTNQLNIDPLAKVKDSALMYLGYRDRSVKEMRLKLNQKGYPEEIIEMVLGILTKANLLNDERFAIAFSRSKIEGKSWGPEKIRSELYTKGIEKELLERVIRDIYEEYSQFDLVRKLLTKRLRYQDELEQKDMKRHIDYLKRRGFRWDVIREVIAEYENFNIE
ncbi:MAG: regulatory protein RecX [Candidatus Marinimicrobia bacterium]|nr:regulatory protein RecX [Candidatus Neomarinimicrobiota bacterium]